MDDRPDHRVVAKDALGELPVDLPVAGSAEVVVVDRGDARSGQIGARQWEGLVVRVGRDDSSAARAPGEAGVRRQIIGHSVHVVR
ncbi:hypothetical protein ND450_15615 [Lentzea sp. HUAS12]|nr:hypothetical protein [Lentzea sp. HUAS12]USX55467.1 hypothetical protein ND450_15615 [Lentzea sp. HUAS12]